MGIDFGNLLGMAGDASTTLDNVVSAFNGLTKRAKAGKLTAGAAGEIISLSAQLAQAQAKQARLETEIVKLQSSQEAVDRIEQRKGNYVLSKTAAGEFIYCLKDDAGTGEPPHQVCPACFERDQIRILQPRGIVLQCDDCKANYFAKKDAGPAVAGRRAL